MPRDGAFPLHEEEDGLLEIDGRGGNQRISFFRHVNDVEIGCKSYDSNFSENSVGMPRGERFVQNPKQNVESTRLEMQEPSTLCAVPKQTCRSEYLSRDLIKVIYSSCGRN